MESRIVLFTLLCHIVSFVTCLAGSAILLGNSAWVWDSVSFLGTGSESLYFFSTSLVLTAIFGLMFIVLSILEAGWYSGQSIFGKALTLFSTVLFLVSYLALMSVAIVSTTGDVVFHLYGAVTFFVLYITGIFLMSFVLQKRDSAFATFSRYIVVASILCTLLFMGVFESVILIEVVMVALMGSWSIALAHRIVRFESVRALISKGFARMSVEL